MENRERSLVPEWLQNSGNGSGARSSNNHLVSSPSSRSDSSSLAHSSKYRNPRSKSDVDSVRSPFLDRSSSTNARREFSNGSTRHTYSSFNVTRGNRDKDRNREKDRLSYMDPWDHDTSFPIGRDQEQLRRSHPMTMTRQGGHLGQGLTEGFRNGRSINSYNGNGILPGTSPVKIIKRPGFDKAFPLIRDQERNGVQDVVRISSPRLTPAVQSLPLGNSALLVGEGWTSALAEVPNVIEKRSVESHANVGGSASLITGPTCRNMAEALAKAPSRTGTPPEGFEKIQRLEDRAIQQSRQLIPVVPSAPKSSALNSSDKSKAKPVIRSGETGLASSRYTYQQSSMLLSSQIKPDTTKKLVVLKPARENGVAAVKESISNTRTAAPATQFTSSMRSTNGPKELMVAGKPVETKPSLAQTQSRKAFYRALKQKTSTNISTDPSETSSGIEEKANSSQEVVASDPSSAQAAERDGVIMERVEKPSEVAERSNGFELADRPDEKEAEFLKSLGWEENNSDEDEGLTEEEINTFIEQCKKFKPALVQKLPIIHEARGDVTPNA